MKIIKYAVTLFFALTSLAFADGVSLSVDSDGILTPYPKCADINGDNVTYFRSNAAEIAEHQAVIAMARLDPDTRQSGIYFDVAAFKHFTPEYQAWVLAHECAHWELGHPLMDLSKVHSREYIERDADCLAAKHLVDSGFDNIQISSILRDIRNKRLIATVNHIPFNLVEQATGFGKTTYYRAQNVRTCINEAKKHNNMENQYNGHNTK